MTLGFRFAVVSDLHLALPHTVWDHPSRFHLVEVSIPALELIFDHLQELNLDFLLLPGDLTQHGEWENHYWLVERLSRLPFPAYVVPGNHDVPCFDRRESHIGFKDFPKIYQSYGYGNREELYYSQEILPNLVLIGLNSNQFDGEGRQLGYVDEKQLCWLEEELKRYQDKLIFVMIHHNVIEHLPHQRDHDLGKRYIINNSHRLINLLHSYGVHFVFTGHLHIQDIAYCQGIYEITTGSLVSYPHAYRVINYQGNTQQGELKIESFHIKEVRGWKNLSQMSRQWMEDRSFPFMVRLLTSFPLSLAKEEAESIAPHLREFWANISQGDSLFHFPHFPSHVQDYLHRFGAIDFQGNWNPIDNQTVLKID